MALPDPTPGLVIRYDYLWTQVVGGRRQTQDHLDCLVASSSSGTTSSFVVLLPIVTGAKPRGHDVGIEIPHEVRRALGLADAPSWVLLSHHNVVAWCNAGPIPIPSRPDGWSYGFIPPALFAQIRARFLVLAEVVGTAGVQR